MHSFLCAALIFASCAPTLGQFYNNNLPSVGADKKAGPNVGPSSPAVPPALSPAVPSTPSPAVPPALSPAVPPVLPPVAVLPINPMDNSSSSNNCSCSNTPNADGSCVAYSKRWQANTIDEAVENFRNPIESDSASATSSGMTAEEKSRVTAFFKQMDDKSKESGEKNEPNNGCQKDVKCLTCMSGVYYMLASRSSLKGINQYSWGATQYRDVIRKLYKDNGIPFALVRDKCKQSPDTVMTSAAITKVYNQVSQVLSCKSCMDQYSAIPTSSSNADGRRTKRQTTVGTTIQVRCDYRRGQLLGDGTNYVGMCNLCWSVRQLPASYTPRMLNEVTCSTDTTCLAGYGICRARYRATNVMYNNLYEVSVNAQSGCECQVVSGSAFFPYVNA